MAANAQAAAVEAEAETEETEDAAAEAAGEQPKRKWLALPPLKYLIIGGASLAVLVGGGVGAYLYFGAGHHEAQHAAPMVKPAVFVDLPEVVVNLSTVGSERRQYLKMKIVLELPDQAMIEKIQPIMPRVMDAFQTYLRELRANDLDGSAGLYRLREELTRRINASISPSRITAVLFKEIIVQ